MNVPSALDTRAIAPPPGRRPRAERGPRGSRRRCRVALLLSLLPVLALSCAAPGTYWSARGLDLWDSLPVAVLVPDGGRDGTGWLPGMSLSAGVTPYLFVALGGHVARSYGMGLGRWGPEATELELGMPLAYVRFHRMPSRAAGGTPWPGGPDARSRTDLDPFLVRTSGSLFALTPKIVDFSFDPRGAVDAPVLCALDSEVHVYCLAFGFRLGISPGQFFDFLAGCFGFDPLGDDPVPESQGGDASPPRPAS